MCVNKARCGLSRFTSSSDCSTVECVGCGLCRKASRISTSMPSNISSVVSGIVLKSVMYAVRLKRKPSTGKFQVIWRVEGIDQDQAEAMLRTLAQRFGGDPAATDST